jgi:choline-sulfatase
MPEARRPNVLMIMADQLSAMATSPYGNRDVQTPNMQALAERGVVFQHAYCNFPLCTPSRASMVTGQLPSRIGAFDNDCELPASVPTFLHHLRLAGYQTLLAGKMHFVGPDQLHGFERRLTTDIYDADFSTLKSWEHCGDPPRIACLPDDPESASRYRPGVYGMARALTRSGPVAWSHQLEYDEEVRFRTLEQIRAWGQASREAVAPWFLCTSFTHPHDPPEITEEYWRRYEGVEIAMPEEPPPGYQPHPADQWCNSYHGLDMVGLTREHARRSRRAYYAMTSYFDDRVGELVGELARFGMLDDTIVIVTSDHGDMVGEHGMWFKRTQYEWSARVPLICVGPGVPAGRRVTENVSLVDLYPTILSMTGGSIPPGVPIRLDGRDLMPLVRGESAASRPEGFEWPNEAFVENYGEGTIRPIRALVKDRLKYIHVQDQPPQLYDLDSDPNEWRNVVDDPAYAEAAERLRARLFDGWDGAEMHRRVVESQRLRMFLKRALESGLRYPWDYQPFVDASKVYSRRRRASGPDAGRTVVTGYATSPVGAATSTTVEPVASPGDPPR